MPRQSLEEGSRRHRPRENDKNTAKVSQHEQVVHPSQQTPISRYHVPRRKFDGAPSSQTARSKLQQLPPGRGRATNTVLEDDDDLSEDETYHDQHDDSPSSSNAEEEEQLRLPRKPGKMVLSVNLLDMAERCGHVGKSRCLPDKHDPRSMSSQRESSQSGQSSFASRAVFADGGVSSQSQTYESNTTTEDSVLDDEDPASPSLESVDVASQVKFNAQSRNKRKRQSILQGEGYSTLFHGTKRREKMISSPGHCAMVKACKGLIVGRVLSGDGNSDQPRGTRCDVWANANEELEGLLVWLVWQEARRERKVHRISSVDEVADIPYPAEARAIIDSVSDARSKVMQHAREIVRSSFLEISPAAAIEARVQSLLKEDLFMCGNGGRVDTQDRDVTDRWQAHWIVQLMSKAFWLRKGAARGTGTRQYFEPVRGETIYYMVTCLSWSISEYSSGVRKKIDINKDFEDQYERFQELWRQQHKLKQEMICSVLTGRVREMSDRMNGVAQQEKNAPYDPHKDDLSKLEVYKQYMPQSLRDRLTAEAFDSGSGLQSRASSTARQSSADLLGDTNEQSDDERRESTEPLSLDASQSVQDPLSVRLQVAQPVEDPQRPARVMAEPPDVAIPEVRRSGRARFKTPTTIAWYANDADESIDIPFPTDATFQSLIDNVNSALKGEEVVHKDTPMIWLWLDQGQKRQETMVSDDESLRSFLTKMPPLRGQSDLLCGRCWIDSDQQSD